MIIYLPECFKKEIESKMKKEEKAPIRITHYLEKCVNNDLLYTSTGRYLEIDPCIVVRYIDNIQFIEMMATTKSNVANELYMENSHKDEELRELRKFKEKIVDAKEALKCLGD